MRRPTIALPLLLGAIWVSSLFAPLLSWHRALANRDIPLFHLPLRSAFRHLAQWGLPVWNPFLHGGQPILSNPNYAAFYPPTWLVLPLPPAYGLSLLAILHAALAFGGAWCLLRRLGGGRSAAALAAVGFAGCGAFLSLLSAFNFFCGMAWLPWLLLWGDAALRARRDETEGVDDRPAREWLRPALLAGGALACQLLSGEPASALVGGLALLALAASSVRRPRLALRILVPFLVAVGLSAVQLLPALYRLADSPRSQGLATAQANTWSAPPVRLVELAFPRFFGDPARAQEGLYFGWNLNDRDYPYVASLYPGLLLLLSALAALLRGPIPRRGSWVFAAAAGIFLALGRFNPLYEAVREAVPVLSILRFPEKFVVLPVLVLGVAGALGWQRLLAEREAGRRAAADLPLALSLIVLATAVALTAVLYALPGAALWFLRRHGPPDAGPHDLERGLGLLRGEGWAALATAAAVALLFALCRARRPSATTLSVLALGLLAVDLWHYGHGFVQTASAALYSHPPPLAAARPPGSRLFVEEAVDQRDFLPRRGGSQQALAAVQLSRLTPYSGLLWRVPYALHADYDLTLTGWGRTAMTVFAADWRQQRDLAYRFLGAWDVGTLLLRKPADRWMAELRGDPLAPPSYPLANAYRLPRFRFPARVTFHQGYPSALFIARSQGYAFERDENCVRPGEPPAVVGYAAPPRILALSDRGGEIRLRYLGASAAFLTVAETFDEGWGAAVDGSALPVYATAACQLGLELPAGEHQLTLRYRERLLLPGALVSLLSLAGCGLLLRRRAAGSATPLA